MTSYLEERVVRINHILPMDIMIIDEVTDMLMFARQLMWRVFEYLYSEWYLGYEYRACLYSYLTT